MVNRSGFLIHGFLFLTYMCSTFYWAVWNRQSVHALDAHFTPYDFLHLKLMEAEYERWLKRYYLCLMQFSVVNLSVQLFTVYIFFSLTRKTPEQPVVNKYSVLSGDSIKRISMLETDKNQPTTPEHRSNSLMTHELGEDDVSNNDRHSGISAPPAFGAANDEPYVEETPEFGHAINQRIFG